MREGLALFKEHVRPALVAHCLDCHGGKAVKGDFNLSDRKSLIDSKAIEGGGQASRLRALIAHEDEPHMPKKAAKAPRRDDRPDHPLDRPRRPLRPAARRSQGRRAPRTRS